MGFSEGNAYWYDQVPPNIEGADPSVLMEWAEIVEKAKACGDGTARVIFRGTVDEENKFSLDVDATDPDAIVCLMNAIQRGCSHRSSSRELASVAFRCAYLVPLWY